MQCQVGATSPDHTAEAWWLAPAAGNAVLPGPESASVAVVGKRESAHADESTFVSDWERWCSFAPVPAAALEAHAFYRDQMESADRHHLQSRPRRRCVWCWQADGNHAPACREMHDEWAVRMPFGKYKGQPLCDIARDDSQYLEWMCSRLELQSELRGEIKRVLGVDE